MKLFGRSPASGDGVQRPARRVRDIGITSAMYGRVFFVALGLVGALGAAAIYGSAPSLVVDGTITSARS